MARTEITAFMKRYCSVFFLIFFSWSLKAHESRPIFIQIKQKKAFVKISYSVPNTVDFRNLPHLELPQNFKKDSVSPSINTDTEGYIFEAIFEGKIQDLKGESMALKFPYFNPTLSTVIHIYFENAPETHVLGPENPVLDLKEKTKDVLPSQSFIGLGIEHIFKGIDHLLFVVCLLLITGIGRKLFWTITGFTVAHSITLFLSVMGFVKMPIPFVEVCIALSIIFLCSEIIKSIRNYELGITKLIRNYELGIRNDEIGEKSPNILRGPLTQNSELKTQNLSLTYRYPFLIASAFGLLHGLGFAAVLIDIGLPENNVMPALLFFNIGVEIGQIVFIGLLILGLWCLRFFFKNALQNSLFLMKITTYAIGTIASFWFFERISTWGLF